MQTPWLKIHTIGAKFLTREFRRNSAMGKQFHLSEVQMKE
jgi:hypothetical protein